MTDLQYRNMTRSELDLLVDWAAAEGWNPGLYDADAFWANDPEAFIAAEHQGQVIGAGAITSYRGEYGFMGFFIVQPEFRGRGFGNALWHERKQRLLDRLKPGASIGMDGEFTMQDYYARGGFVLSHRNLRFQVGATSGDSGQPVERQLMALADLPFDQVLEYDRNCFPAPRREFLELWIRPPEGEALGYVSDGKLRGYGVIRKCRLGCKIGPLFADSAEIAGALLNSLLRFPGGGPVFIDMPENHPDAMELVGKHQMKQVFGCARMYFGLNPPSPNPRVFGVTTFELG